MQWNSASEFFAMNGYGLYVWLAFGVAAVFMLTEPFLATRRHARALQSAATAQDWKEAQQ